MKHIFLLLYLIPCLVLAQSTDATIEVKKPQINLKLDVNGLLNPFYKSSGVAVDYFLNDKVFLQAEVGYYFHSIQLSNQKGEQYRGLKTQLGVNYIFDWRKKDFSYVGVLFNNRFIKNNQYKENLIQDQFIETKLTERKVTSVGANIVYGNQWYVGKAKNVFIEWYLGIGAKLNWVKNTEVTTCVFCNRRLFIDLELNEGIGFTADGYLFGLNIGFTLK